MSCFREALLNIYKCVSEYIISVFNSINPSVNETDIYCCNCYLCNSKK